MLVCMRLLAVRAQIYIIKIISGHTDIISHLYASLLSGPMGILRARGGAFDVALVIIVRLAGVCIATPSSSFNLRLREWNRIKSLVYGNATALRNKLISAF